MTLFPITVPSSLAASLGLDPTNDEWGQEIRHAVGTEAGDTYVLSGLWRHDRRRAEDGGQGFVLQLITRHTPDGETAATAVIPYEVPGGTRSVISWGDESRLALLPDGTLVLSSRPGNTHLLAPGLDRLLAGWRMSTYSWTKDEGGLPDDPFAASVAVTPGGRLLCLATETSLENWGVPIANLVAVTDPGAVLAPGHKPVLRALTTLSTSADRQSEEDARPHVRHGDAPVLRDNRPPSLLEQLPGLAGGTAYDWNRAFLRRPAPLSDELYVVPVYGRTYRSGSRGQRFAFTLLDDRGTVRGRLDGMDRYQDSPYTGHLFDLTTDPHRGRAFHLNRYGLYAWTADGALRAKLPTTEAPFKALTHFSLLAATPAGELLLAHRKQHLLLRVPAPADLADLPAAVAEALAGLAKGRNAAKRRHAPENWLWSEEAGAVHHL
ncbi:hypothetical protein ACIA8O_25170 [Kitasatospora sp. NPDC051853]|uniref:hypothetical protein n=1 Tax=Kitasatospora sp. NPDC051853 TaxID=3364058 RepID=UPI00378CFE62